MVVTIIILLLSTFFFVTGRVRSDIIALSSLLGLLIFQVLTPEEALSGFSSPIVIMMIGLFVVGGAIFQTGLAKMIGSDILRLAGKSSTRLFILVMLVTSGIGAFVSNTGTVALMMPILVSLAMSAGINPRRYLMPLAFAGSLGGMLTLIGTPPNLIIQGALTDAGYQPLSFFSFFPVGVICITVSILVLLPLSKFFLNEKANKGRNDSRGKSLDQLVSEYRLNENLFRVRVTKGSDIIGKTIVETDLRRKYNLHIMEIRRAVAARHKLIKPLSQHWAAATTVIKEGDLLYVSGQESDVREMAQHFAMDVSENETGEGRDKATNELDFYNLGLAELLVMPQASIINRSVTDIKFRDRFKVNVLSIRRKGEYISEELGEERIHGGDVILVQGAWEDIGSLTHDETNWVVLGQPLAQAAKVTLDYKAPIAATIMILMILLMVLDFIPVAPVTAVMIAGLLMVLGGCFRNVDAAYKTINWETIVLFAGMMPMSVALQKTGVSDYISDALVSGLGSHGPLMLLAGIYLTTSVMTLFISNTVTALLMAPIALHSAQRLDVSPLPMLFAVTVGASMCFASPFSTPPNALVMSAGQYTFTDYLKVGLPLQVIMGVVMVMVLPLIFPF